MVHDPDISPLLPSCGAYDWITEGRCFIGVIIESRCTGMCHFNSSRETFLGADNASDVTDQQRVSTPFYARITNGSDSVIPLPHCSTSLSRRGRHISSLL